MLELFAAKSCPFCAEMREQLEWDEKSFVEYDVEADPQARARLIELVGPHAIVPVLVEDGRVAQTGWQGRGCAVGSG
jgi:glutaredoxin 3